MYSNVLALLTEQREWLKSQGTSLKNIEELLSLSKTVLNLNEVSLLTGYSKSTLYKLTYSGKIPCWRKTKHLLFDRDEIENWLRGSKHKTPEEMKRQAFSHDTINHSRRRK
jgi:excisionase family DNA binding protein